MSKGTRVSFTGLNSYLSFKPFACLKMVFSYGLQSKSNKSFSTFKHHYHRYMSLSLRADLYTAFHKHRFDSSSQLRREGWTSLDSSSHPKEGRPGWSLNWIACSSWPTWPPWWKQVGAHVSKTSHSPPCSQIRLFRRADNLGKSGSYHDGRGVVESQLEIGLVHDA